MKKLLNCDAIIMIERTVGLTAFDPKSLNSDLSPLGNTQSASRCRHNLIRCILHRVGDHKVES